MREQLERFSAHPDPQLHGLIIPSEIEAACWRADQLRHAGLLPHPDEDGPYPPYPWPLV